MNSGWLYKLEKKFGKYCIPGLIKYIIAIELIGAAIGIINPAIYNAFLSLDFYAIFHGQVWRLITFIVCPEIEGLGIWNILMFAIEMYIIFIIGSSLERAWGSFRFNMFYLSGILLSIVAALLIYVITGVSYWPVGLRYINETLFLAFAFIFPDVQFLLFFLIPVKAKWLGIVYAAFLVFDVIQFVFAGLGGYIYAVAIVVQLLNFLLFFLGSLKGRRGTPVQRQTRKNFRQQTRTYQAPAQKITPINRHRCAICGRTERDNPDLEFRFCSKCDGNYEYCSDHIYTHEHVHN